MVYRNEIDAQTVELVVEGDLNETTAPEFRAAMYAELDRSNRRIKLDLGKVRSINSASIGAMLLFQKKARAAGKEIIISKFSSELRTTFVAIRLDRIVAIAGEAPPTVKT